jgi:hypothetical protein
MRCASCSRTVPTRRTSRATPLASTYCEQPSHLGPLKRAAARTGLTADELTAFVAAIGTAGTLTVVTGTGCTMAAEANVTEWLAWALQIATGSFERPGGA